MFITKARALNVLAALKANPTYAAFSDRSGQQLPYPTLKRPDSAMFNRDGQDTDDWFLVWPNGYNEECYLLEAMMQYAPSRWPLMTLLEYQQYCDGHHAAMPGTDEGIVWKD